MYGGEEVALSIPDHLPNSPLCLRHPKYRSGGAGGRMGECPFHGGGGNGAGQMGGGLVRGKGGVKSGGLGGGQTSRGEGEGEVWW